MLRGGSWGVLELLMMRMRMHLFLASLFGVFGQSEGAGSVFGSLAHVCTHTNSLHCFCRQYFSPNKSSND
jgi:hypothetical protein